MSTILGSAEDDQICCQWQFSGGPRITFINEIARSVSVYRRGREDGVKRHGARDNQEFGFQVPGMRGPGYGAAAFPKGHAALARDGGRDHFPFCPLTADRGPLNQA